MSHDAEAGFEARAQCAVCQAVEAHAEYAVLTGCGHVFHALCLRQWLERSKTCPSCRAKAPRSSLRLLAGIDVVSAGSAAVPVDAGALQQHLMAKLRELETVQQGRADAEQAAQVLQQQLDVAEARIQQLQGKLGSTRTRVAKLEDSSRESAARLSQLSAERERLLERYKTDVLRLQQQLKDEERRHRHVTAQLQRFKLANPALNVASIRDITAGGTGAEPDELSNAALAAALAARNDELRAAQAHAADLQQGLQQQHAAAARELASVRTAHAMELTEVHEAKQQHLKEALALDYENSKLRRDNESLQQQLQELRGVLLALEGGGTQARQLVQGRPLPLQRHATQQQQQQQIVQQEQQLPQQELQRPEPCNQRDVLDVTAALGPGSLLRPLPTLQRTPSFVAHGREPAGGATVTGVFIRRGPDGRGATALHASGAKRARPAASDSSGTSKRRGVCAPAGQTGIAHFLRAPL